ncbi:hypothetical protein V474_08835 [Novosphingobium barchaimii LL02]|uniref:DUF1109 domain-containing protein n=1 Tax=Novosphingobium barchaimii LL02 TaxID=1114963 RepID=A0A0J7Y5V9_9SPHN|nr:NrsF family protein [Novosphingobium barchaimii]KMS59309.1 hypothetical protein V474_08835 [Novosphingobium barchaimii LL02]
MVDHDALIDTLCHEASPVRRVAPAWRRALAWAPVALGAGYLATQFIHRSGTDWAGPMAGIAAANIALSLMLGLAAFIAALSVSVAGGAARLNLFIVAGAASWLSLALYSISISGHPRGELGHGSYCFTFVLAAGIPMILVTILALRRTRSLTPVRSLTLAGAGIAFLSFALLAFCHPIEMSAMDFMGHLGAGVLLGAVTVLLGRKSIAA